MVTSARQAIACILVIFGTSIAGHSQTISEKAATSSISGRVTIKGKGVSGIAVGLILIESQRHQTTRLRAVSDVEGNYRISNIPPGTYEVVAVAPTHVPASGFSNSKTLLIGKSETIQNIDFALLRGGVITGKVTDAEGRPAIEEPILVSPADTVRSVPIQSGFRTDDRGIYRAFGLPPGKYKVSAGADKHSLHGVRWRESSHKRTYHPATAETSEAKIIEVTEGSEATNVDITVGRFLPGFTARGRIVDGETDRPLSNLRYGIQTFYQGGGGSRSSGAVSNQDGEFKLENLGPGSYAVYVEAPADSDWRTDPLRFEIVDQDVTGLILRTSKGGSASGVIVVEGTDEKNILANLTKGHIQAWISNPNSRASSSQSASINTDGTFRVNALPAGLMNFWLSAADRLQIVRVERDGVAHFRGVEIKEFEHLTGLRVMVNQANATIRGVVRLATGTPPIEGQYSVWLRRVGDDLLAGSNEGAKVDTRGQFIVQNVLPGTYEVHARLERTNQSESRMLQAMEQVVVTSGAVINVTLTLQPQSTGRP